MDHGITKRLNWNSLKEVKEVKKLLVKRFELESLIHIILAPSQQVFILVSLAVFKASFDKWVLLFLSAFAKIELKSIFAEVDRICETLPTR